MEDEHADKFRYIMTVVTYSLVCVLGLSGNGVVIWATGFRMKKTVVTVWYLNLAVADFLATAVLPFALTETALSQHWPFGSFVCKMGAVVLFMNMYASVFILTVISVDRCVCVACPVWARCSGYRTVGKASWVSLGVWVLAMALSAPNYIFRDTRRYGDEVQCYFSYAVVADYRLTREEFRLYEFRSRAMTVANFIAGFVVPFSVIVSCYSVIIYRLGNSRSLAAGRSGRRSFKIIAAVIAAFFLCWVPFHVIQLIIALWTGPLTYTLRRVIHLGFPISFALALANSCLNPLLYVFLGRGFKDAFRRCSLLKLLEKAFAEEPSPQTADNAPCTDPAVAPRPEVALCETEGSAGGGPPAGTRQDPSCETSPV